MYERLIKWLYYRTREGRQIARNNEQRQDKYIQLVNSVSQQRDLAVKQFCEYITQGGFKSTGIWYTEHSAIKTFANQTQMVLVQLHKDGTLNRVFVETNDNNLERVASKLLGENNYMRNAIDQLNDVLKGIEATNAEMNYDNIVKHIRRAINTLRNGEEIA